MKWKHTEVYCDMESAGGWMLFGDLKLQIQLPLSGSLIEWPFSAGEVGSSGYSIDYQSCITKNPNEPFDVMIQYGGEDYIEVVREGYTKNDISFGMKRIWSGEGIL